MKIIISMALGFIAAMPIMAAAQSAPLPQQDNYKHQGVASCASSFCHGALNEKSTYTVLQNEYITWTRHDRHAKAYQTLHSDESKRIAANLGLPNAHTADVCLDCHADNVPKNQQGVLFDITDGVGCEACHGGAEKWIGTHITGSSSHGDNIAAGLYPTEVPEARAELCLSCHYGTKDKFATHRIMGAGHPRIGFELDTFTALQPAHYKVDADYEQRKSASSHVQTWGAGLVTAAEKTLNTIASPRFKGGLFPELAMFDCHSCHHAMDDKRYGPRPQTGGIGPGQVRLNDSTFVMLRAFVEPFSPRDAKALLTQTQNLHKASTRSMSALMAARSQLQGTLERVADRIKNKPFSRSDKQAMLRQLIKLGKQGEFRDYVAAEQAVMAIDLLLLDLGERAENKAKIDKLYSAVEDEHRYRHSKLRQALQGF